MLHSKEMVGQVQTLCLTCVVLPPHVVGWQSMALQWVQRNIHHLGGDRGRVTIFGESSGSCSVFLHTVSPLSAGLFSRAIAQESNRQIPSLFGTNCNCCSDSLNYKIIAEG